MSKIETDNQINFYIEDANIYTLWKLARPDFCPDDYFYLDKVTPLRDYEYKRVFAFIAARFEMSNVVLKELEFCDQTPDASMYPPTAESLKDYDKADREAMLKAFKRLDDGKGGVKDVVMLSDAYGNIYQSVYFNTEIKPEQSRALLTHIDEYIEHFLGRELFVYDRNYWTFEKQKEHMIGKIRKMQSIERFGSNFIVSELIPASKTKGDREFLFVHTLYALQKLGYIRVLRLWHTIEDYNDGYTFHANIVVFDPLVQEINSSYRKDNPALIFEGYDDTEGVICFAGKKIAITQNSKENDAVALMRVLVKELDTDKEQYWYQSEIAEDTGNDPKDVAKNKYYYPANRINDLVKMETGTDDLVDHTTKKFRINPKYLKS